MRLIKSILSAILLASTAIAGNRPATHGMLIFGTGHQYASHLPMFHSPHDYQTIFEINFDKKTLETYLNDKAQYPTSIYTFVPKPFVLTNLNHGLHSLYGVLYHGHFEKDGTPLTSLVKMTVRRILAFNQLNPSNPNSTSYPAIIFGAPGELFMAHQIEGAPNFDQIVELVPNPLMESSAQQPWSITFNGVGNQPVTSTTVLSYPHVGPISIQSEVYLEFDDLRE